LKAWKDSRSIDNLSTRLNRLEATTTAADEADNFSEIEYRYGLTEDEYEKLSLDKKAILRFNWYIENIMPYYKAEVMRVHNLSEEEYNRRTLEGDQSIYLPQPNRKYSPTLYMQRAAHVLGLDFKGFREKVGRGEIKDMIVGVNEETGCLDSWRDEDSNAVF
jgi:hypothetical protein